MKLYHPIVEELIQLLKTRTDLGRALEASITKAARPGITNLQQYFAFLDKTVTMIPTDRNQNNFITEFYYLIEHAPDKLLQKDPLFQKWVVKFIQDWGSYLDTPESAKGINVFFEDPAYHLEDYFKGPSGWLTFNQFFARQVKPGRRLVDDVCDESVVVSPTDSIYEGQWTTTESSKLFAKDIPFSVLGLLDGSPYQGQFEEGTYVHTFLNVHDYHRYHAPVSGTVKEVRKITGKAMMDVIKRHDGTLGIVEGSAYPFTQDRGLVVMESMAGLVAIMPIGMAQVSSVNLTVEEGSYLQKGNEFGYFSYGGSDIVMLFQKDKVNMIAEEGKHYKQGQRIGEVSTRKARRTNNIQLSNQEVTGSPVNSD
jgi:phosphatidylserine decarboxylase